jgi:hypothetical protein
MIYFFYRLNSRIGNPSMQIIQEEKQPDDEQQNHRATPTKRRGRKTNFEES